MDRPTTGREAVDGTEGYPNELELLTTLPVNIPKLVKRTDNGNEVSTYPYNLLGWVLSIISDDKAKTKGRMPK